MKIKFYDVEVFPEWWCVVVSDELDNYTSKPYNCIHDKDEENKIKKNMRVYTSDVPEHRLKLLNDLRTNVATGYNNKRYDGRIIHGIALGYTPEQLYQLNNLIIFNEPKTQTDRDMLTTTKWGWNRFQSIQDLMDDSDKGLKDKEAAYGISIEETTVPFGKRNLTLREKLDIIKYCKHDVYALHIQYAVTSKPYIDTKLEIGETFGVPQGYCYRSTNARLTCKALDAVKVFNSPDIDNYTITIDNPELLNYIKKYVPDYVVEHLLTKTDTLEFELFGNKVTVADGGLHSIFKLEKSVPPAGGMAVESSLVVKTTKHYVLFNFDGASYYPAIMIFLNAMPRSIMRPERFISTYNRRLELKKTPKSQHTDADKRFVNSGKTVLNTVYGAAGNKWLPILDNYMRSKVCRVGQLLLLAIANDMYTNIPECKIIQGNTDGLCVYMPKKYLHLVDEISEKITKMTSLIFETEFFENIFQLNVNNYLSRENENSVKEKGKSFNTNIYMKGLNKVRPLSNFVVNKAKNEFYLDGKNPMETILNHKIVSDFVLTGTKGPTFTHMQQENTDDTVTVLGKVTRVIAVKDERLGRIFKVGKTRNTIPLCPDHPLVVEDSLSNYYIMDGKLHHNNGDSWDIDYDYYKGQLDSQLNVPWYIMTNDQLVKDDGTLYNYDS